MLRASRVFHSLHRAAARNASTLVVAEHNGASVNQGTLACVTAASKIGGDVTLLVMGGNTADTVAEAVNIAGVSKVLFTNDASLDHNLAENTAKLVQSISGDYTHILTPSSNIGKNFMPRLGAMMDSAPLSDVIEVVSEDTFVRPIYAGSALATVQMKDSVKLITTRTTAFDKAEVSGGSGSSSEVSSDGCDTGLSKFVSESVSSSDRPDLTSARVVVSGGRGMKNGENFAMLEKLADKLGGAVGASRAAVDAGFVPNELQIGQTGKVVAPELYIAVGISGAIQHLSGMKDSKTIVAINKDKEAPIFQVADYGIAEDLFKVVPEMTDKL
jgi:electron transfer flavoprotein alpha subunit